MKRWIAAVIMVLALSPVVHAQAIPIPDPELRMAVATALGNPTPTAMDMLLLRHLRWAPGHISSLVGLEFAFNLESLDLRWNDISDLKPLEGLTNLEVVWLWNNQISDVSPLGGLTNLRDLQFIANSIEDVSSLDALINLERLDLQKNRISDVSPLGELANLEELRLPINSIRDISSLDELRNLKFLDLSVNQISDISPLVELAQYDLDWVALSDNPLNQEAYDIYIPELLAAGVIVVYDPLGTVTVPDVVGMSQTAAEKALQDEGFVVWITTTSSETVPVNHVINQDPVGGAQAALGSAVTLTISTGPGAGPDPVPGSPRLLAHWTLDETTGLVASDSAGGHDGRLHGNPTWRPVGGIVDGALALDGVDDYVRVETVGVSRWTQRSIAGWVRASTTQIPHWTNVFGFTGPSGERGHFDIEVVGQTGTTTGGYYGVHIYGWQQDLLPVDREWHHFAATFNGAQVVWYADGAILGSELLLINTESTFQMGKRVDNDNFFPGLIDDVRVYDQALRIDQIQAAMVALPTIDWHRAAYWDPRYPTNWAQGHSVRAPLGEAGYEILNADQLKTWMDARIADGWPSVVVFCQDVAPDTVLETATSACTLRKYLNAGGKIVWYGGIPLYYQGRRDGTMTTFDLDGSLGVLGLRAAGGTWDIGEQVTLTDEGRAWGLTHTWPSVRPAQGDDLRVLARDSRGQAAAWVKHYLPGDTYAGFVRFFDCPAAPNAEDVRRLAEYPNALRTPGPDQEGLVAHYEFEGNAEDPAGGHHGAVHGATWTQGIVGRALRFDGDDYVEVADDAAFDLTDAITVAAWVNLQAQPHDWIGIVTKGDSTWRLSTFFGEQRFHFAVNDQPGSYHTVDGVTPVNLNEWHHVAGTFDGSLIRLYVDGVEDPASPTAYHGRIHTDDYAVWIGANAERWGRNFVGLIDEVMIYDRALSLTEIVDLVALTD